MSKITDNSNELSFHQLTSTSSFLLIPLFQRPYVWTQRQLERMIGEINAIVDEEDKSRFLGAVIAVTRPTNPSEPTPHEIVDGQQRLTTLYLFLLAAAQVAAREGKSEYSRGLISTNLIVSWAEELPCNTKLQPSIGDRAQFRSIFNKVSGTGELTDWLPIKARLPQSSGVETGPLSRQYQRIHAYLQKSVKEKSFEALEDIVEVVRNSMTFVFILLKDPGSATTVFEGLNDPGVPISVGDLVKNEVFSRVGYDEPLAQGLHDRKWVPFRDKFGDSFDDFFFPFSVIRKPNTNRTEMFSQLRDSWKGYNSEQIIDSLDSYSMPYLAIHGRIDATAAYGKLVGGAIQRLVGARRPSSIYPFVMPLLNALTESKVKAKEVVRCLEAIESFLVRRSLCGIEPTGLLGLFRTMWAAMDSHPNAEKIHEIIRNRTTIEWPNDQRVREAVTDRPLYGTSIAKFVVLEYDRAQGVDHPPESIFSIEHVLPKSYASSWSDCFSVAQHKKFKNLWANLVPLSQPMNNLVDQLAFDKKKKLFSDESMFKSTRLLGSTYNVWTENEIAERSATLSDWAVDRWPRPS